MGCLKGSRELETKATFFIVFTLHNVTTMIHCDLNNHKIPIVFITVFIKHDKAARYCNFYNNWREMMWRTCSCTMKWRRLLSFWWFKRLFTILWAQWGYFINLISWGCRGFELYGGSLIRLEDLGRRNCWF